MPLPLQTLRVLPNPWAMIHAEKGPQGACLRAPHDMESPLRFVGAERNGVVVEKRPPTDPRGDRVAIVFTYPALDASLLKGEPETVSALPPAGAYYRDRLADGSLIPGDERTAKAVACKYATLEDAKKAGVAEFDAHHGEGSWLELEALLKAAAAEAAKAVEAERKAATKPAEEKAGRGRITTTTTPESGGSQ